MNRVLTLATPEMSPDTLQERSLAFKRDAYFEADALVDLAFGNKADFVCQLELWGTWGDAEKRIYGDLQIKLDQAEDKRRKALAALEHEMAAYIRHLTSP